MSLKAALLEPVTFVGAGPGDPELLTIKGQKAIGAADVVIHASDLVSPEIVALARPEAQVWDGACLDLSENHRLLKEAAFAGKKAVQIHTGDPSLYSPLPEQLQMLAADGIPWRIIPGITAALAGAAMAGIGFSIPGMSQSLIITRLEGNFPMPQNERLENLARSGVPLAIYLGGHRCEQAQAQLGAALPPDTPVICCSRIGWAEEKLIHCTVGNLAQTARKNRLGRQTVLLVVPYLAQKDFIRIASCETAEVLQKHTDKYGKTCD